MNKFSIYIVCRNCCSTNINIASEEDIKYLSPWDEACYAPTGAWVFRCGDCGSYQSIFPEDIFYKDNDGSKPHHPTEQEMLELLTEEKGQ
jgi:hypothetical protein